MNFSIAAKYSGFSKSPRASYFVTASLTSGGRDRKTFSPSAMSIGTLGVVPERMRLASFPWCFRA